MLWLALLEQVGDGYAVYVRFEAPRGGEGRDGMDVVEQGIVPHFHEVTVQAVQVNAIPVVVVADEEAPVIPQVVGLQINRQAGKLWEG